MKPNLNVHDLADIPNPSALVSLSFCNRDCEQLVHLPKFKNVTDLDISNNNLTGDDLDLKPLRFLKRLNLSENRIRALPNIPSLIENLNLSSNGIRQLSTDWFGWLRKLHTINLSNNELVSLDFLWSLPGLRWLFLGFNQINSLSGIESCRNLLEIDVEYNQIQDINDLTFVPDSVSVVNIQGNAVQRQIMCSKRYSSQPLDVLITYDLQDLDTGILFRHVERLKELKTSRFGSRLRERGQTSQNSESVRKQRHHSVAMDDTDTNALKTELTQLRVDNYTLIAKLKKSKGNKKAFKSLEGDYHTLQNEHKKLVEQSESDNALFDDLITYAGIDEQEDTDFSFSRNKFETACQLLREHEDDRNRKVATTSQLQHELDTLKGVVNELNSTMKAVPTKNPEIKRLQAKNQKLKTIWIDSLKKLSYADKLQSKDETQKLKKENAQLKHEIAYTSRDLMSKIRELENQNEVLSGSQSFSSRTHFNQSFDSEMLKAKTVRSISPNDSSSQLNMSYFRKDPENDGNVVINKTIGQYIERLKDKISRLNKKICILRKQRDSFKSQVHSFHN